MIRLYYSTLRRARSESVLGPAPFFRIAGRQLQQGPHSHWVVGWYSDSEWEIDGYSVSSYEIADPTRVYFEDSDGRRLESYGPFRNLRFPNGCCIADGRRLASLAEEDDCWVTPEGRGCRIVMIVPADVNLSMPTD